MIWDMKVADRYSFRPCGDFCWTGDSPGEMRYDDSNKVCRGFCRCGDSR